MTKKLIGACLLLATLFAFPACKKEYYSTVNQAFSAIYTIQSGDWKPITGANGYATSLNVPELTKDFVGDGAVLVYLSFDAGTTYEAIPEVFNGIAYGTYHGKGYVGIDLRRVDGGPVTAPGGGIKAKVILVYTEPL